MRNVNNNDCCGQGNRIGPISRRRALAVGGSTLVASMAGCLGGVDSGGGEFPSETIRTVIAFGEGGGTDIYARKIWGKVSEQRDVTVEFDNVPGAGGMTGASEFVTSEPNGHTIAPFNAPGDIIPSLIQDVNFSFENFRGIAGHAVEPFVIVSNPDEEVEDFEDMASRYRNGEFKSFAGMQPGTQFNVVATILKENTEFDIPWESYIPYDGSGGIGQAVAGGEVPVGIITVTTAEEMSDRLDIVVGLVDEEIAAFPDVDTVGDFGYPSLDYIGKITRVTYAPPETPDEHVEWLDSAAEEAITSDELQSWADEGGLHLEYMGGPDYVDQLTKDAMENIRNEIDLEQFRD
ncbi:Bug family tripartite tricarboxylate transporter substrate binding protein [Natrinema gelatinilyticum]|uniref:Bug family tripartite tricarboxylate transporter substrate binding protein n=1 Tax=Natrinema gelatinilyticum TaxID=2961571 RepID=UPI0020C2DBC4|nr:tripartite tricarboxylate transporter substrate-binding protein [Natrinema gelatinilyticum]